MPTDSDFSENRLSANRKNAQHSTGARTEAGKAISARNALTLGLFTKRDYVRRNEQTEYNDLCARFVTELNPEGVLEETLLTAIVSASWRLRRCSLVEYSLAEDNKMDPMQYAWNRDAQNSVDRARAHASLLLRRSILELRHLQSDRFLAKKLLSDEPDLPALASAKQVVTAIDRRRPAQPPPHQQKLGSNCRKERQMPRSAPCPCGSGEKFKRCCLRGEQSVRPYPHDGETKPGNPGQKAA